MTTKVLLHAWHVSHLPYTSHKIRNVLLYVWLKMKPITLFADFNIIHCSHNLWCMMNEVGWEVWITFRHHPHISRIHKLQLPYELQLFGHYTYTHTHCTFTFMRVAVGNDHCPNHHRYTIYHKRPASHIDGPCLPYQTFLFPKIN